MISQKKKICKGCGKETYIFGGGMCQFCRSKSYTKISTVKNQKTNKSELDNYFTAKITELLRFGRSEESGQPIPYPIRGNICHILDKSRHKSVADHSENFLFLTMDEHSRFDKLLFEHRFDLLKKEFPNSWKLMEERLPTVFMACTENTKLKSALEELILNKI